MDPRIKSEDDGRGFSFLRGGNYVYNNGNLGDRGDRGRYWESRLHSSTNAYNLYFYSTYLGPQGTYGIFYRGYGYSIRCVVR